MADRDLEQEDPRLVAAARHALHDEELVAAFAVDGEAADDVARARQLIERCTICRDLHADVVAIGSTIKAAGTAEAVGAVREAPRDYRLSASDAVRLRGGNVLERIAARFRDGLATFGQPVGASLAALGVVGLLVGTMALTPLSAPGSFTAEDAGAGAPAPGATVGLTGGNGAVSTPPGDRAGYEPVASARDDGGESAVTFDGRAGPAPVALLFAGSIVLVFVGVALLLAGSRRRRRATGRTAAQT